MNKKENFIHLDKKTKAKNNLKCKLIDQQTSQDTPKKISFKMNFIQWLRNLPLDERYLAVKVYAPGLAKKIQQTLIDLENDRIQQSKKDTQINKKISSKQTKQILESIVLISDGQEYFDNIGFDFSYIEHPERLYDLLTSVLSLNQKQMYLGQEYQIDQIDLKEICNYVYQCNTKQELAYGVINFMRGEIFINFQQKRTINLEQQRKRKKEFSMFWRNLSEEAKSKILLLQKQDIKALFNFLDNKKIYIQLPQLQKQFNQLIKMEKNQFCNRIFKCKLKRSLTYLTDYHELIYKSWKSELLKRKRRFKHQRNQNPQKSNNILSNNLTQVIDKNHNRPSKLQKQHPQPIQTKPNSTHRRRRNRNRRKKSQSAQSKQTKATTYKFVDEIEKQQKIESSEDIKTKKDKIQQLIDSNPEEKVIPFPQIDYEMEILGKINNDIQEYSDLINQEANEFYERRVIAYERIQFILSIWKIPIKLFGSCASGITIKNSDIDIAVDNSILNYFISLPQNNRLRAALQQLEELLQQQPWVTNLKLIKTAAVPVIKMKVDTSINFTELPGCQIYPQCFQSLNRQHLSSGQIHIDLTIETINKDLQCNHLGIISTDCINKWLKQIKCLHPIVIIIKNYLTKTNLNITYEGGLNTYSMICMIVAFIKDQKLEHEKETAKLLKKLVKFYAYEFDEKLTGIDLNNKTQIFYDKYKLDLVKSFTQTQQLPKAPQLVQTKSVSFSKADLEIKDPLNNGKNMTKNCYSFPKIKQVFKKIYEQCFVSSQHKLQKLLKEKFQQKFKLSSLSKQKPQEQLDKQVKQLLKTCKDQISNPFLTLFE